MDGETMVVTENRASPSYIVPLLDGINKLKVKSP
jgi:hypothetical protein